MTPATNLTALLHNAALLLALVVVYDLATSRYPMGGRPLRQVLVGVSVGFVGVAIMQAPLTIEPGIVFDTRSVLLAVSGLFLGVVPTIVAMTVTAAFRLLDGGAAAWTGVAVIAASGGIGVAWGHGRRQSLGNISWRELYGLGLTVHVVMLALMLTLPWDTAWRVLAGIALPVLIIYPPTTGALGTLLAGRVRREAITAALRENEEQFRAMFETASIGMAQADVLTGKWLRVNGKLCEITGYSAAELLERRVPEITHPDDRERDWEAFQRVVRSEAPDYRLEERYVRKDGSLVWVNVNMTVIRTADGQARRTMAIIEDISERKRAEDDLRAANERWARLLSANAVGVVLADTQGGLFEVNDYYLDLLGFTRADFEAGKVRWDERTPPEHLPANWRAIAQLRDRGISTPYEKEYIRKDGSRVWALVADALLPGAEERILAIVVDITERKRAEEEARRLLATAEQSRRALLSVVEDQKRAEEERQRLGAQLTQAQKMESVGRLAGGVAHDFNNALGVILGHAELAMSRLPPGEPLRTDLAAIEDAALRSANLTRQLLAFARRQTIVPKVLDLNDAVAGMLKMLRRLIGEDIELAWIPGPSLRSVRMDPAQVDQVLANLMVNARDAIGGVGKVTVETKNAIVDQSTCAGQADRVPGEYVMLAISDDGCGMTKEILDQVFEPFFTTKAVGKGTGLGLATVYGIVQQNAGFIAVTSEPGKGSTFRLYFPRVAKEALDERPVEPVREPRGRGETVLLVEDEAAMLEITDDTLNELGYLVLRAGTPAEAITLAQERAGEINLVVTDVVMPEMNGRDLARRIAEIQPGIRCLFVSGYTSDVIAHHGVLDEGVRFLQKPFSRLDLALMVRQALDDPA